MGRQAVRRPVWQHVDHQSRSLLHQAWIDAVAEAVARYDYTGVRAEIGIARQHTPLGPASVSVFRLTTQSFAVLRAMIESLPARVDASGRVTGRLVEADRDLMQRVSRVIPDAQVVDEAMSGMDAKLEDLLKQEC